MGCDIGGSLAKMVMAFPEDQAEQAEIFPEKFGTSGRCHRHLQMTLKNADQSFLLTFLSGATSQLEEAVAHLGDCRRQASEGHLVRLAQLRGSAERERSPMSPGRESEDSEGRPGTEMKVELEPVREMRAMVDGFLLLAPSASLGTDSTGGSNELSHQDIFTINEDGTTVSRPWPEPLFPLILVIMGTGVSVLRVDSAQCGDFVRVGGTACGGGTFLGLARLLTSATSFEEALEMASWGDASNADKLVSDIYGEEGCSTLGLPGNLTASNFGKLGCWAEVTDENDLARSLLQMVTQQSVLLASAHARLAGCINRVFFAGGFVDEKNVIARKSIALNFRNLGGCAYFLRHSDFLGALGSLQGALRAAGGAEIGVGDVLSARSKTRNHREHVAHNGERGPLLIQSLLHRTN
ncbi:4'-phosphopantetheine phosphatase (Inactive pantothenic acid kinase 4) (hPanK4) [Durusdinium trenchii]|uniref:4'-phosphopantetheine phosphatase (Inactive pantothenic acid kinase 4) (HPanK4) n=1 Tax=Durusdinium trenchii TaxID=1381693 RepID=A0ABP0IWK6_9DINO